MRLLVIVNPAAGRRRRRFLRAILRELVRYHAVVTVQATACRGDAERLAAAASARDYDRLVVAGGDGTVNEVINGLVDHRLPVAIVPLGTANVLAAELDLPTRPRAIADAIMNGTPRAVALGAVNGRCFTMMAGIGFDAQVVANVSLRLKRVIGKFAYVVETLRQLRRYRATMYEVMVDGRAYRAASAIVAKGRCYGGRFVCAPLARLDSPAFQVCLFGRAGRWHVLRYAVALMFGRLHRLADVTIVPARHVAVAGPVGEPVQGDGDTLAQLPADIGILTDRLRVIVPA